MSKPQPIQSTSTAGRQTELQPVRQRERLTHKARQTDRPTDRLSDNQVYRKTERQTDPQPDRRKYRPTSLTDSQTDRVPQPSITYHRTKASRRHISAQSINPTC